jgi:hypothetical protein
MLMRVFSRNKPVNPKLLTTAGTLSLAISIAWPRFFPATGGLTVDAIDLIKGVFLGIALGLLFLALRLGGFGSRRKS